MKRGVKKGKKVARESTSVQLKDMREREREREREETACVRKDINNEMGKRRGETHTQVSRILFQAVNRNRPVNFLLLLLLSSLRLQRKRPKERERERERDGLTSRKEEADDEGFCWVRLADRKRTTKKEASLGNIMIRRTDVDVKLMRRGENEKRRDKEWKRETTTHMCVNPEREPLTFGCFFSICFPLFFSNSIFQYSVIHERKKSFLRPILFSILASFSLILILNRRHKRLS